jgi:hypothetical protein
VQAVERLARGNWLEGDHNVVRASEHESLGAQNCPIISGAWLRELLWCA